MLDNPRCACSAIVLANLAIIDQRVAEVDDPAAPIARRREIIAELQAEIRDIDDAIDLLGAGR